MIEKRGRGQTKFEPTQDQRNQVKLMKALGIPGVRICKTITNPRTNRPVAPTTLARAFARRYRVPRGGRQFYPVRDPRQKAGAGRCDQRRTGPHHRGDHLGQTKMGWKETVVNEPANKDDKPFLVDDARQLLIDEVDRITARKE
jgi:hypothetical protein